MGILPSGFRWVYFHQKQFSLWEGSSTPFSILLSQILQIILPEYLILRISLLSKLNHLQTMKYNFSLTFLMLISGLIVSAQTIENSNLTRDSFENMVLGDVNSPIVYSNRYEGLRGTPFLSDDWVLGELVLKNNNRFNDIKIKYDMMENNVLVMSSSGKAMYPSKSVVMSFHFKNNEGVYRNFVNLALVDYDLGPDRKSGFCRTII